jgi:hypothetical protein
MLPDPLIFFVAMVAGIVIAKQLRGRAAFKTVKTHN